MKTINRKISLAINTILISCGSLTLLPLTSCGGSEAIQFANYESYMSQDLMDNLQNNLGYPIQFPYYTTAEMIPAKFESYYDVAVPTGYELMTLLRKGWISEVDWAKFNVTAMDGTVITNSDDAAKLFAAGEDGYAGISAMNTKFSNYLDKLIDTNPNDDLIKNIGWVKGNKFNILKYGIPYFAQSFMFAYKGDEIDFYTYSTNNLTTEPTWADIFWTISPSNPNQPAIFKNNKIGMVDDARSFYDLARMVETAAAGQEITNDPILSPDTKDRMFETMCNISNLFSSRSGNNFILNTDSQIVSKTLADRKCGVNGIMSWSGDTIYAAQGAEEYESFTNKNLHIVKPAGGSQDEIDFVVINKKNKNNVTKLDAIYKAIKQICLSGCNESVDEIVKKSDDNYKYWSMVNWDEILYTPLLKNIYKAVTNTTALSEYWTSKIGAGSEEKYTEETVKELFIKIIDGSLYSGPKGSKHLFGGLVSNLQNSNIHWAWIETKDRM